jgi:hypothetical protein
VATFSTLSIDAVGAGYTLTASSGTLSGGTSSAFDITVTSPLAAGPPAGRAMRGFARGVLAAAPNPSQPPFRSSPPVH